MADVSTKPFHFNSYRLYLRPTGHTARTIKELVDGLGQIAEASLWYHLHHAYVHYRFDGPRFRNDIAVWLRDVFNEEALSEQVSYVDSAKLVDLEAARGRLRATLLEWHRKYDTQGNYQKPCADTEAFHFLLPQLIILSTGVSANTLAGFASALRQVTPQSIFFHTFEARLRSRQNANDFSAWIDAELGLGDLSREISLINPFFFTVDQYRDQMLERIHQYV